VLARGLSLQILKTHGQPRKKHRAACLFDRWCSGGAAEESSRTQGRLGRVFVCGQDLSFRHSIVEEPSTMISSAGRPLHPKELGGYQLTVWRKTPDFACGHKLVTGVGAVVYQN
jgi:hypothetical protein